VKHKVAALVERGIAGLAEDFNMTPWEIRGRELANCNCAYGCPCQFNALPTDGTCEAAVGYQIDKGHYGQVNLDGTRCGFIAKWPGPIHEGNGEMQIIIDESASSEQREALQKIMTGEDTEDMATMWWVFSAMAPSKLETLYKPIDLEIDVDGRRGRVVVPDVFEIEAEPIRNPVTGAEHRARIDLPHGFEYRLAEMGSGTTKTSGSIELKKNNSTYAQFADLHLSHKGVVEAAA
jgi:hypothetical protein